MKIYFELSSKAVGNGRRPIKIILHEIYPDNSTWNINGISWIEEHVLKNLESIAGMSICAEFIDEDRAEPFGHGLTELKDNALPLFEDATVVGHCTHGYVDTMTVGGMEKRVCVAEGTLDEMRYPKFIEWLEEQLESDGVNGSVEIVGLSTNDNKIIYDGGFKKEGRIPIQYDYSGYAILGAKRGSDATAVVVELNSDNTEKEVQQMDYEKIMAELAKLVAKVEAVDKVVASLKTLEEKTVEMNELSVKVVTKDAEIEQLKTLLEDAKEERKKIDTEYDAAWAKIRVLEEEIAKKEIEAKVGEMTNILDQFTEEQKAYAKVEIDAYLADPTSIDVNAIVGKIYLEIAKKTKEDANVVLEKNTAAEIFAHINSVGQSNVDDDDDELY